MAWVCPLCRANNPNAKTSCAVCGGRRFYDSPGDFVPWEDHPVLLDRAALLRRGFVEIYRVFSGGRERYLLRDRDCRECALSLEQLLCMGVLNLRKGENANGQANSA